MDTANSSRIQCATRTIFKFRADRDDSLLMKMFQIFALAIWVSCAGCGSLCRDRGHVYGGIRQDWSMITNGWPCYALDIPFSTVCDTLSLPFDLANRIPEAEPLKDWKKLGTADRFYHPYQPAQAITDDYQRYINRQKFDSPPGGVNTEFFQDGTGRHAVSFTSSSNGTYWRHILFYNQANKRIKTMKYITGHYAC